jgi:CRP-like cAMP-binding protein
MFQDLFQDLAFFQGLGSDEISLLRTFCSRCFYTSGTVLFEQGSPAEYLYIVVSGQVVVSYKPEDGPALVVAHVHSGNVVGWSAALGSHSYTSSAHAHVDSELIRIKGADLRNLCEQYPGTGNVLLERLTNVIVQRMHSTHPNVKAMLQHALNTGISRGG